LPIAIAKTRALSCAFMFSFLFRVLFGIRQFNR